MNERDTLKVNEKGHLELGGADCVELAKKFGTPLYLFDETYIRKMMGVYRDTLKKHYGDNGLVLYASKAFSCQAIYRIADEENIGIDVVSGGELYTALQAGFPAERIYMHGNNKLDYEIGEALDAGIGCIVADAYSEIDKIDAEAKKRGMVQRILLRINPGVEAHTHAFVQTATTDSKFGFSIADGTAEKATAYAMTKKNVKLDGYHCHIGSQIFEKQSFVLGVEKVMDFAVSMKDKLNFTLETLNMGGGFGIWYTDEDRKILAEGYAEYLEALIQTVKEKVAQHGLKAPYLLLEPGRSIVGEAGVTLYTVGAIKDIPGVKKYVAVDGGMFDNPRYALYQSKYTPILANRANEPCTEIVSIAGKCCESGDLIAVNVSLPKAETGDILAVLSTGAYNYSMAMNYNRNMIPPCVLVRDGEAEYIVKPQSYADIVRNDVIPSRLLKKTK
ncbi:MAG: diaminopimelate decarboxylase [Clostridiales bacterium]|nr:diaminopimelate decarboxylase [Clostridiales bacterium]